MLYIYAFSFHWRVLKTQYRLHPSPKSKLDTSGTLTQHSHLPLPSHFWIYILLLITSIPNKKYHKFILHYHILDDVLCTCEVSLCAQNGEVFVFVCFFVFFVVVVKPFIEEEMNWLGKFSVYWLIFWKWKFLLLEIMKKDTVDKWDWRQLFMMLWVSGGLTPDYLSNK